MASSCPHQQWIVNLTSDGKTYRLRPCATNEVFTLSVAAVRGVRRLLRSPPCRGPTFPAKNGALADHNTRYPASLKGSSTFKHIDAAPPSSIRYCRLTCGCISRSKFAAVRQRRLSLYNIPMQAVLRKAKINLLTLSPFLLVRFAESGSGFVNLHLNYTQDGISGLTKRSTYRGGDLPVEFSCLH